VRLRTKSSVVPIVDLCAIDIIWRTNQTEFFCSGKMAGCIAIAGTPARELCSLELNFCCASSHGHAEKQRIKITDDALQGGDDGKNVPPGCENRAFEIEATRAKA
jgi:hypothetical protein